MADNRWMEGVLADMKSLVERKNEDYAEADNPFSNFEGAARAANTTVDTVFAVLLGIKLERITQLTSGKTPKFEALEDSILDMANYAALWLAWRRRYWEGIGYTTSLSTPASESVADKLLEATMRHYYSEPFNFTMTGADDPCDCLASQARPCSDAECACQQDAEPEEGPKVWPCCGLEKEQPEKKVPLNPRRSGLGEGTA